MIVCDLCKMELSNDESERPCELQDHGDYCKECTSSLMSALNGNAIIIETIHLSAEGKLNLSQEIKTVLAKYPKPTKDVKQE